MVVRGNVSRQAAETELAHENTKRGRRMEHKGTKLVHLREACGIKKGKTGEEAKGVHPSG